MGAGRGEVRSRGLQIWSESGVVQIIRDVGINALPAVPEAVTVAEVDRWLEEDPDAWESWKRSTAPAGRREEDEQERTGNEVGESQRPELGKEGESHNDMIDSWMRHSAAIECQLRSKPGSKT